MKKLVFLLLLIPIVYSCSKEDDSSNGFLKELKTNLYYIYNDNSTYEFYIIPNLEDYAYDQQELLNTSDNFITGKCSHSKILFIQSQFSPKYSIEVEEDNILFEVTTQGGLWWRTTFIRDGEDKIKIYHTSSDNNNYTVKASKVDKNDFNEKIKNLIGECYKVN